MPTGAGKSVTGRLIAAQALYRGDIVVILDIKWLSHSWAVDLPNVIYARTVEEIHEACLWLSKEVARRNEVASGSDDRDGIVHANVGPRIVVITEELNVTQNRLRKYWNDIRTTSQPKRSPASEALDELMFMGRQVRINVVAVAQRLSSAAVAGTGLADSRENMGTRMMGGRYTASTWKMLCPDLPMPPANSRTGRVQVVTDRIRECQIGWLTGNEAHDMALAGTVAALPHDAPDFGNPNRAPVTVPVAAIEAAPPKVRGVTLAEAVEAEIVDCNLKSLHNARGRHKHFPEPIGKRPVKGAGGAVYLYDPEGLAKWNERKGRI